MKEKHFNSHKKISKIIKKEVKKLPSKILIYQMLIIFISIILCALSLYKTLSNRELEGGNILKRDTFGGQKKSCSINVDGLLPDSDYTLDLQIDPILYTKEEADNVFYEIFNNLENIICNEDDIFSKIEHDLNLPHYIKDKAVYLRWTIFPSEKYSNNSKKIREYKKLVDKNGRVHNEILSNDEIADLILEIELSTLIKDEDSEKFNSMYSSPKQRINLSIYPASKSAQEILIRDFNKAVEGAFNSSVDNEIIYLPKNINGQKLKYSKKCGKSYLVFPFLGIFASILLFLREKMRKKEHKEYRNESLRLDYCELVSKLIIYMQAGLTLKNAFIKITRHYEELIKSNSIKERPLHKELKILSGNLENNVPQHIAYRNFSLRTDLREYNKLCSLLEQNRKNGSGNLKYLLELEMDDAFEARKTMALRLGEKAGTKLLLPLFILLIIIIIIVGVPAVLVLR